MVVALLGQIMDPVLALWALSWAAVAVSALGVVRMGHWAGMSGPWPIALGLASITMGMPVPVYLNGLETGWSVALATWMIALRLGGGRGFLIAALAGLAPFLRPELAVLSAVIMFPRAFALLTDRSELKRAAAEIVLAAGVALSLSAAQVALSGSLLPGTASAKAAFFALHGASSPSFIADLVDFLAFFAPVSIGFLFLRGTLGGLCFLYACVIVVALYLIIPVASHVDFHRYFYILAPVPVLGLALAQGCTRAPTRTVAKAVILVACVLNTVPLIRGVDDQFKSIDHVENERRSWAKIIAALPNPERPILVHDIGTFGLVLERPLVDIVGLRTRCAAQVNELARASGGDDWHGDALAWLARESGARYLLVSEEWDDLFRFSAGLTARGWTIEREPVDALRIWYRLYEIKQVGAAPDFDAADLRAECRSSPIS